MLEEVKRMLWNLTVPEVTKQARKLGVKTSGIKSDIIDRIIEFYHEKNWIENTYKSLNEKEKAYLDNIIQQKGFPTSESIKKLDEQFKDCSLSLEKVSYFYIGEQMPTTFQEKLEKIVPALEISFTEAGKIDKENHYGYVIMDNADDKYNSLLKIINKEKIKITSFDQKYFLEFLTKTNLKEVIHNTDLFPHDITSLKDTTITYGMLSLLEASNVITQSLSIYQCSYNYNKYIKMNQYEKIKFLLDNYLNSPPYLIDETKRVTIGDFKFQNFSSLTGPRRFILNMIKKLPIDTFVTGDSFIKNIRMKDINFLRQYIGDIYKKDEWNWYDDVYDECSFNDFDKVFIHVCLIEYFAVLGLIDVIIDYAEDDYENESYLSVSYLKLTKFGSIILGVSDDKIKDKEEKKFIVNDKFEIIIPDCKKRMEYELYFDIFLEEKSKNDKQTIYNLDFKGIAKALDIGLTIDEIISYLEENSISISNNVIEKLFSLAEKEDKINIQNVTILTYPIELEEEIKKMHLDKYFLSSSDIIKIIDQENSENIKKKIEENNLFCKIEGSGK